MQNLSTPRLAVSVTLLLVLLIVAFQLRLTDPADTDTTETAEELQAETTAPDPALHQAADADEAAAPPDLGVPAELPPKPAPPPPVARDEQGRPIYPGLPELAKTFLIDVVDGAPVLSKMPKLGHLRNVRRKKQTFFDILRPIVQAENRRVAKQRLELTRINHAFIEGRATGGDKLFLGALALEYRLRDFDPEQPEHWDLLRLRVDEVPLTLALAQAANESAWGGSRFAQQGNNLFGQWCFSVGCGMVPKRRNPGALHEVATFDTVNASVRAYILNLNTTRVYRPFRLLRAEMRERNEPLSGRKLVPGLSKYSERGQHYIDEIRAMIRVNRKFMLPPEVKPAAG